MPSSPVKVQKDPSENVGHRFTISWLIVLTAALYLDALKADFVNWDDQGYIFENLATMGGLTWRGLWNAFFNFQFYNWHPLVWLSYMLDIELFGTAPLGFHAHNVALHCLNVALLFSVLDRYTGKTQVAILVATLFAIHPMHVESVAWISERKDVLSTAFWLGAMLTYETWARSQNRLAYMSTLALFALGLLAKPMLVTFPFVLLLLDYWPLKRMNPTTSSLRQLIIEKIPLLLLAAGCAFLTFKAQSSMGAVRHTTSFLSYEHFMRVADAYGYYLKATFAPFNLAAFYPLKPFPEIQSRALSSVIVLGFITTLTWLYRKRKPAYLVGWLWFLGTLVPVVGFIPVGAMAYADRYTYIPHIGLFLLIASAGFDFVQSKAKRPYIGGLIVFVTVIALTAGTLSYIPTWQNGYTLWTNSLAKGGESAIGHGNLGDWLYQRRRYKDAQYHFFRSVELASNWAVPASNLGLVFNELGEYDTAIDTFGSIIAAKQSDAITWSALSDIYARQQQYRLALANALLSLGIFPQNWAAHIIAIEALIALGENEEAQKAISDATRAFPRWRDLSFSFMWQLATDPRLEPRDLSRTKAFAERLVRIARFERREHPQLLDLMAITYANAGNFSQAISLSEQAAGIAARHESMKALAPAILERAELYRTSRVYRRPPSTNGEKLYDW